MLGAGLCPNCSSVAGRLEAGYDILRDRMQACSFHLPFQGTPACSALIPTAQLLDLLELSLCPLCVYVFQYSDQGEVCVWVYITWW